MAPARGAMVDTSRIGWREVVVVAALAVGAVLAIEVVTTLVPGLRDVLGATPILALVLVVVTGGLLWRIATRAPGATDDPDPLGSGVDQAAGPPGGACGDGPRSGRD